MLLPRRCPPTHLSSNSARCCEPVHSMTPIETEETMTARDMTGYCAVFSTRKSGNFVHFVGHNKPGEGKRKNPLEIVQKTRDGAPKLQISIPCRRRTPPDPKQMTRNLQTRSLCQGKGGPCIGHPCWESSRTGLALRGPFLTPTRMLNTHPGHPAHGREQAQRYNLPSWKMILDKNMIRPFCNTFFGAQSLCLSLECS